MQYQYGSLFPIRPNDPVVEDFHDAKVEARRISIEHSDVIGMWAMTNPAPKLISIFHDGIEYVQGDSQPLLTGAH